VTVAERTEVLAGVGRVVMAARRNASGWLTIWPIAGATIRIDMDMKTMVTRRQTIEMWRDPQALIGVG